MLMDEGMDTGPILLQRPVDIRPNERAGALALRLADAGADVIVDTLDVMEADMVTPRPQDSRHASHAPSLTKADGAIRWTDSAMRIENLVRGMDPWPGTYTYYRDEQWRVWDVEAVNGQAPSPHRPGTVLSATRDGIDIATGAGTIRIRELQPASRRRMSAQAYLSGHRVPRASILTATPFPHATNQKEEAIP